MSVESSPMPPTADRFTPRRRIARLAVVSCLLAAGCQTFDDSAISVAAPISVAADGASIYDVEVCAVAEDLGDVDVIIEASGGEWLVPLDPGRRSETSVRLDASTPCAGDRWIVSRDLRPVRFRAIVDQDELGEAETNLTLAPLSAVEFSPSAAFLASAGESVIEINVRGIVATEAETAGMPVPTLGTRVILEVQSEPPGMAAMNDRVIVFGNAESRTLQASPETREVIISARSTGGDLLGTLVLRQGGSP